MTDKSKDESYRFQRLYRNLYNPEFYWLAYKNIYANKGSMTAGADGTTIDGMSDERINGIINTLRDRSYRPKPAKRVYIVKKNSNKKRPLGIQSGNDKLVQEAVKMILESTYEPVFSNKSHGFRPNRSCQTALMQIQKTFTGTNWFVEGDIHACFDSFDHHIVIDILRRRIEDEAFTGIQNKCKQDIRVQARGQKALGSVDAGRKERQKQTLEGAGMGRKKYDPDHSTGYEL